MRRVNHRLSLVLWLFWELAVFAHCIAQLIPATALEGLTKPADTFPITEVAGVKSKEYQYVRIPKNKNSNGGIANVLSPDTRCYQDPSGVGKASTVSVKAGSRFKFVVSPNLFHPGPVLYYMAQVPPGKNVATWEAEGNVWFKVDQLQPTVKPEGGLKWQAENANGVSLQIPTALPSGDYLLRVEHIALHGASKLNGAQLYVACAQVRVTDGGSGDLSRAVEVAFPGPYRPEDPGIKFNLYSPPPKSYIMPGPPVWRG